MSKNTSAGTIIIIATLVVASGVFVCTTEQSRKPAPQFTSDAECYAALNGKTPAEIQTLLGKPDFASAYKQDGMDVWGYDRIYRHANGQLFGIYVYFKDGVVSRLCVRDEAPCRIIRFPAQ